MNEAPSDPSEPSDPKRDRLKGTLQIVLIVAVLALGVIANFVLSRTGPKTRLQSER